MLDSTNPRARRGLVRRYLNSIARLHIAGFAIVFVLLIIAGGATVVGIGAVRGNYSHTVTVTDVLANLVVSQQRLLDDEETGLRGYLLTHDQSYLAPYNTAEAQIGPTWTRLNILAVSETGAASVVRTMESAATRWQEWARPIWKAAQGGRTVTAQELAAEQAAGKKLFDQSRAADSSALTLFIGIRTADHGRSDDVMTRTLWIVGGLIGIAALVMALVGWIVTRAVSRPLRSLGAAAARVGKGDLEDRVAITGTIEFETMAGHMDQMRLRLRDLIGQLQGLNGELSSRSAELQAANGELEAFSYSVSHDLRSPLRAIDGFSRIVRDEYADGLPEEGLRFLEIVCENAVRMGRLIDDLLAFSQLTRKAVVFRAVDMTALVKQVVDDLAKSEGPARIEVSDLPPCIGDPMLLRQVLVNLIGNAVKYSSKRSEPLVSVGSSFEDGEAVYWVRDNGVGFDMRYAAKLFGVFQRLHRSEDFEGTGVGLAIVQRILIRHNGKVWAQGVVNEGATFFFTIHGEKGS